MCLDGNFTIRVHDKRLTNGVENPRQLTDRQSSRRAASEVDRLESPSTGSGLSRIQHQLAAECPDKCLCGRLAVDFEVECTEMAAPAAKRNMDIQTQRLVHSFNENGAGFEKSRSKTISISSVDARPRLRTWDDQAGCRRSESNTCFNIPGLMSDSHC